MIFTHAAICNKFVDLDLPKNSAYMYLYLHYFQSGDTAGHLTLPGKGIRILLQIALSLFLAIFDDFPTRRNL